MSKKEKILFIQVKKAKKKTFWYVNKIGNVYSVVIADKYHYRNYNCRAQLFLKSDVKVCKNPNKIIEEQMKKIIDSPQFKDQLNKAYNELIVFGQTKLMINIQVANHSK